jgi:glycosyltransferase involved in cell wall biosynthesis
MRVLHIYSGNLYGGVETLLVTLARHRDLCPSMEPHFAICFQGRLSEELAAVGAKIHFLGNVRVRQPLSVLRARRALRDVLRAHQIDIAICHSAWPQAIFGPAIRRAKLPLVFWLHNAVNGHHWLQFWARRTPPDLALCNSRFVQSSLPKLYRNTPNQVIHCPVSPIQPRVSDAERQAIRAELNVAGDTIVIVQTSRMEAWKGHHLLLHALIVLNDIPGWTAWIVGGAQRPDELRYMHDLKKASATLGIGDRVRFLGQRSDVPQILAAADIHCQPNTGPEPFGITFVEALYAGVPVVTTAMGGGREVVDDSCGILAPPADPQALAASLRTLIQDGALRRTLGAAGPTRARRLCDPATQMTRLAELLSALLKKVKNESHSSDAKLGCRNPRATESGYQQ